MDRRRVILVADWTRPDVAEICTQVRGVIARHAEVVGELPLEDGPLEPQMKPDLAVVVGGDGTLIRQARRLADIDVPIVGINYGHLGFLAEFDAQSFAEHARVIFGESPRIHEYMLLKTIVRDRDGHARREDVAVNDCVITAGPPFRMIQLQLCIDETDGPQLSGDGVIIATPTGSTAYNSSAGGPIVHPTLQAIVITPLAAHSLAFRPIVLRADSILRVKMQRTNPGTSLLLDGDVATTLRDGDVIEIRQHTKRTCFVANPATTYWRIVLDKLRWAVPPSYRDSGG